MNDFYSVKPLEDNSLPQLYIETYGCQMNVNDSEVVLAILQKAGYSLCRRMEDADVILANTCSIRDNAEQRIWGRIDVFRQLKKKKPSLIVGILGCMAERLKDESGLWLNAGSMYGTEGEGFMRWNIACPRSVMLDGLERFRRFAGSRITL